MNDYRKIVATLAIGCLVQLAAALPASADRVMLGYYATFGDLEVQDIPFERLTHLCHAFLVTDDHGQLVTGEKVPSRPLTEAAHQHGVKVLISLGGGKTASAFEHLSADAEQLGSYLDQVVALVVEYDYDGVDVDWEFPRTADSSAQFTTFVTELRAKLTDAAEKSERKEAYLLTAAVSSSQYFGKHIDTDKVVPQLDWLNIMTYDFSGPWDREAGHNAPLLPSPDDPGRSWRSVKSSLTYWHEERKVPADKLVVGLPFYGRAFPATQKYQPLDRADASKHGVMTYSQIRPLLEKNWQASWDEDSQVPWMQPNNDTKLLIAYDDRNSIYRKTLWAKEQGYRGVFFWALHQDRMPDGRHWLVEAAYKAWPK